MSGLGGLNKAPDGVVIGLVQLQNPVVVTKDDLARQTETICVMVAKARRNLPTMDLVVFPEYALHGLSMDTNPDIICTLDGPEVAAFKKACVDNNIWGCFSIMELNPGRMPFNSGIIIDDRGKLRLYYRKMHPWIPVEPWEPGDIGIPVCDGPNGSKLALIICHDGMFPEMAREAAYKGANVMLRTAGYTAPIKPMWHVTNQANAFCNLMYTASVCLCGDDGSFNSMGEGMIVNHEGTPLVTGNNKPDEIITGEVRPRLCDEARNNWGVENNIYQFGHRGYVAVKGGAQDCPYTYMQDLMAGQYRLPWEDTVKITDGTSCGFPVPARLYSPEGAAPKPMRKRA
jgi:formamidase